MTPTPHKQDAFKRCCKCREVKTFDEFHRNRRNKDGYTEACKACNRARAHHYAHPEYHRATHLAWRTANPEKWLANSAEWARLNPDKILAASHNKRAKKAGAEGRVTGEELAAKRAAQNGHCAYCKGKPQKLVVDHIIPLSKGGTGYISNICFACTRCNGNKRNLTPEQWVNRWYQRDTVDRPPSRRKSPGKRQQNAAAMSQKARCYPRLMSPYRGR